MAGQARLHDCRRADAVVRSHRHPPEPAVPALRHIRGVHCFRPKGPPDVVADNTVLYLLCHDTEPQVETPVPWHVVEGLTDPGLGSEGVGVSNGIRGIVE